MLDADPRLCRVAGRPAWHIRYRGRRLSTGCPDRAGAVAALARFRAALAIPEHEPDLTVSALLDRYLADREDADIPGLDRLKWAKKALLPRLGDVLPEHLTAAACRSYARQRAKDGVAPSTARTELQALSSALRWGIRKRVVAAMPEFWLPPRAPARERWLTRDEAERLVAACRTPHVLLAVLIMLHTAARVGAVLALTWDRVDLEGRLIDFREPGRAETRKRRVAVPINDTLLAAIRTAHEGRTSAWVVEYAGKPVASLKHAFRDAVSRAKLGGKVTPHVLRHSAVTWMVSEGVPLWEVAGMAGMTLNMVETVYGHLAPDHLRKAAAALG